MRVDEMEKYALENNVPIMLKDGIEYPAYCLNKDLKGASSDFSYSVNAISKKLLL